MFLRHPKCQGHFRPCHSLSLSALSQRFINLSLGRPKNQDLPLTNQCRHFQLPSLSQAELKIFPVQGRLFQSRFFPGGFQRIFPAFPETEHKHLPLGCFVKLFPFKQTNSLPAGNFGKRFGEVLLLLHPIPRLDPRQLLQGWTLSSGGMLGIWLRSLT